MPSPRLLAALALFVAPGLAPQALSAAPRLHPAFGDHMVIQRDRPAKVWGRADPGAAVTVTLTLGSGKTAEATATADAKTGEFGAELPAQPAQVGAKLAVKAGGESVELTDVLFGDVWLCGGQSNMEWRVEQLPKDGQREAVAKDADCPTIRLLDIPNRPASKPQPEFAGPGQGSAWRTCAPTSVGKFTAVGYFFARELQKHHAVPVGLVSADWGGTPAEAWTTAPTILAEPAFKRHAAKLVQDLADAADDIGKAKFDAEFAAWKKASGEAKADGKPIPKEPQRQGGVGAYTPSALYNGMIAPLRGVAVKGALWYQGEANAGYAQEYRKLLPAMVGDWRKLFGPEMPFLVVTLAPWKAGNSAGAAWAELRDAQIHTTKVVPHAGYVVITDHGDEEDIHPQAKRPVGERLALVARKLAYGEDVLASGPTFDKLDLGGKTATVTFASVGDGLKVAGDELHGFAACGADNKFYPATAKLDGKNRVALNCDKVEKITAVRFGWVNFAKPALNLFNSAGLPAAPFRTDDSPPTTR